MKGLFSWTVCPSDVAVNAGLQRHGQSIFQSPFQHYGFVLIHCSLYYQIASSTLRCRIPINSSNSRSFYANEVRKRIRPYVNDIDTRNNQCPTFEPCTARRFHIVCGYRHSKVMSILVEYQLSRQLCTTTCSVSDCLG